MVEIFVRAMTDGEGSVDLSGFPKLRTLRAVAAVAKLGSTSHAATMMHLTQPAISQAIRRLETMVGEPLFTRVPTGLYPTDLGAGFADRINRAFAHLVAAERELGPIGKNGSGLTTLVTIVHLRAVILTVETGSLTLAAERLSVSQPSVNRAIRDLETLWGTPLFERTPRGMEPSRDAISLARYAGLVLAELQQAVQELREGRGVMDGSIAIGCLPLARAQILPRAVLAVLQDYPDARIRIVDGPYNELLHELRRGNLDLILGALRLPPPTPDIVQEALFSEPLAIIVRRDHPIATLPHPTPEALAQLDWIVAAPGAPARQQFERLFTHAGLPIPTRLIECGSLIATRALVLGSDRAVLLSERQVGHEIATQHLIALPLPLKGSERPIGTTTRLGWKPTRLQTMFLQRLRQSLSKT
jgi:LysR family transcriptional regulator of gallate degradation